MNLQGDKMKRPNILILMPDQMRADCLSCAGHPVIQTPNFDRIAAEGVRFPLTYTTCPVCMPARSSFLSGLFCHNHGQWANYGRLPATADTYARRLKAAGYHTCHIGKSHLYPHRRGHHLREDEPFMHALGWEDVLETTGPHATCMTKSILTDHWERLGLYETFLNDYIRRGKEGGVAAVWPSPLPPGETLDDFVGRTACEYLESYSRSEPWLVFVGFGGPHEPWDPPAEWAALYEGKEMNPPQPPPKDEPWLSPEAAAHRAEIARRERPLPDETVAKIRALYYAKISHIDDWVGRILGVIERRGWWDNTAVVVWSDHGEMLGDRNLYRKTLFYDASARVPLVLRLPDRRGAGSVRTHLVSLVDLVPTLLEIGGAELRKREFGKSLLPLVTNPHANHHDAVFSEIHFRTMIRDERYKMVVNERGAVLKLYDMVKDPGETRNLAGCNRTGAVIRRLRERLLQWHLATATDWNQLNA